MIGKVIFDTVEYGKVVQQNIPYPVLRQDIKDTFDTKQNHT